MKIYNKKLLLSFSFLFLVPSLFISVTPANAATPSINVNEIMYNPLSGNDGDEFIELYNTTGAPIDVSGWCFTEGVDGCFASSTVVAAGDYILAGGNAVQFNSTYGKTIDLVFSGGKLSNGGEQLVLEDDLGNVIFDITYDDQTPWPSAPDGGGPSLELKDPLLDPTLPINWSSSLATNGTPGELNSVADTSNPVINNFSKPSFPSAGSPIPITVETTNASTVDLTYKVMFEPDVTISMFDDGLHNDGAASDGVFGVDIPSQSSGDLVRYKIAAMNGTSSVTEPPVGDGMNYRSFIIDDGQTADLPIVRWYIDDADFTDLTTNHLTDDQFFPTVVAVGDEVFDNARVRVRGQSSVNFPKRKYKFELPSGYTVLPDTFDNPVDEFSLNVYFLNFTDLQETMAWNIFNNFGFRKLQSTQARVQKNNGANSSEFYGHYLIIEGYDKSWRERSGVEEGALYKQRGDKKTRLDEDNSDITDLYDNLTNLEGQDLKKYISDNLNVPSIVNFHALATATLHQDWSDYQNIYQYRDTEGTKRWEYVPWDLDNSLAFNIFKSGPGQSFSEVLDPLHTGDDDHNNSRFLINAVFQFPEYREMYFARLSTLYDEIYSSDFIDGVYSDLFTKSSATINEDLAFWSSAKASVYEAFFPGGVFPWEFADDFPYEFDITQILSGSITVEQQNVVFLYSLNRHKNLVADLRAQGIFPAAQPEAPNIVINEIMYNPTGGAEHEYLELHNPNDYAVDVSGWKVEGVGLTLPLGSVIPAKSYALVVKNDVEFRSHYGSGKFIISEYGGKLANEGELIKLLRKDGSVATQVSYEPGTNGWAASANGQGRSLELIKSNGDASNNACWAPSAVVDGSPGLINNPDTEWVAEFGGGCADALSAPTSPPAVGRGTIPVTGAGAGMMALMSLMLVAVGSVLRRAVVVIGK